MSVGDWSRFALGALKGQEAGTHPRWALVAALRALRFDASVLATLARAPGPLGGGLSDEEGFKAQRMVSGAPPGRLGLIVQVDNPLDVRDPVLSVGPAQLYIPASNASEYDLGLDWLLELEAFEGQAD